MMTKDIQNPRHINTEVKETVGLNTIPQKIFTNYLEDSVGQRYFSIHFRTFRKLIH